MISKHITCLAMAAILTLGACAKSQQGRNTQPTGFLGDYSMLQKGGDDEALLIYRKQGIPLNKYYKVIIDPVVVWMDPDSDLADLDAATRQHLANRLHYYMRKELSTVMTVVDHPSVGTIRFQMALTDAESSNPLRDAVSTVLPFGIAMSAASQVLTGKPTNVGGASIEIKVSDAMTGEIIGAAADKRVGGKSLDLDTIDKWADVDEIMKYWAKFTAYKICLSQRSSATCTKPDA